jgi:hypothetical protein
MYLQYLEEEYENTKGVIIIRTSKKNTHHNGQKKKDKRTNNDLQDIHIKLRSSNTNPTKNGDELRCSGRVYSSCSTGDTHRKQISPDIQ